MQLRVLIGVWAILATIPSLAGCKPDWTSPSMPDAPPPGLALRAQRASSSLAIFPQEQPAPADPVGVLTLRQALAHTLLCSPRLAAYAWEVRAAEARALQAGLPVNPELGLEIENVGGSGAARGFRGSESTLLLSQAIELGGKRTGRARLAELERQLAGWDYETARVDAYAQTARAFVEVLAAQERLTLAQELVRVAQGTLEITARHVQAGRSAPLEQSRARAALGGSRITLERARRDLAAARQELAAAWGAPAAHFERVEGDLTAMAAVPSAEQVQALVRQNPDVARWNQEMEQRRAALALEKARAVPDLTLVGGVRRLEETDDTGFVFGVALPLPIFDRNQGGIRAARHGLARAAAERRLALAQAGSSLALACRMLAATRAEAEILRDDVLPAAQEASEAVVRGYEQGKFAQLDVLDAQRTLFEARGEYIEALAAHHQAAADVERLIGQSLSDIAQTPIDPLMQQE